MKTKFILLQFVIVLLTRVTYGDANAGGMDGGGGGTLPAQPVPIYQVREIAEESKPLLLFLLNYLEKHRIGLDSPGLGAKLFDGPRKAQEVLKYLRLEVREESPCYTKDGREVDGSIHGTKPNTICLSAFSISKKIDVAVAKREILALLIHEISHFLGADELEASSLQKKVAWTLQFYGSDEKFNEDHLRDLFSTFRWSLSEVPALLRSNNLELARKHLNDALLNLQRFEGASSNMPYLVFGPQEESYQDLLRLKLTWAREFLNTQIQDAEQELHTKGYLDTFGGREFFMAHQEGLTGSHPYRNEKIIKLHNLPELIQQLEGLIREYDVRSAYVYQATYGNHWITLDGHLTIPSKNPWLDFLGRYHVESIRCDREKPDRGEIEFRIEQHPSGTLFFTSLTKNSSGSDRLELGAYNVNRYLNRYGSTPDGGVYFLEEMGGTWTQRMYIDSFWGTTKLLRTSPNRFQLIRESHFDYRDPKRPDQTQTCIYEGTIQR